MPQSFAITFHINDVVTFGNDVAVPQDLQEKSFSVSRIKTLILNDFYFNNDVFTCYELTQTDDASVRLFLTPFRFEDDDQDKLRLTKPLSDADLKILFPSVDLNSYFRKTTNIKDAQTITIPESVPSSLHGWLGRSYYLDSKDSGPASAYYVDHDPKNKKNLNPELLLAKHAVDQYSLFQGDYGLYYLEADFEKLNQLLATLILEENCITTPLR